MEPGEGIEPSTSALRERRSSRLSYPGTRNQGNPDNLARRVVGLELNDKQKQRAGMAFHHVAGLSWAPVYQLLRRRTTLGPVAAGLVTGASMSLVLDETITPAIGASAPTATTRS